MEARDDDFVNQLFVASTHSFVFFFTDRGKVYVKKVYEIPLAARSAKGRAIVNFVGIEPGETHRAPSRRWPRFEEGQFVVTLTTRGQIKKTEVIEYENYREKGIIGVKIDDDDQLSSATVTDGSARVPDRDQERQVDPLRRGTGSAHGARRRRREGHRRWRRATKSWAFAATDPTRTQVLAVCEHGYGKRTPLEEFRQQNRGGKGIILIDASDRNGPVVGIALVMEADEVMLITDRGQTIRTRVSEIRETGRNAQGVKVMSVEEGERVVALEAMSESSSGLDDESLLPPDGETAGDLPPAETAGGEDPEPPAGDSTPDGDEDGEPSDG